MAEVWAKFNTETNAIDSIEKGLFFLGEVKKSPENWKWVVICCHQALYGFAVHVAKGTDDSSVITKTKKGRSMLISFDEALNICKSAMGAREALITSAEEDESIRIINKDFRNNFEHFNPRSWMIDVSGFPIHLRNFVNVTKRVAVDINFYNHLHGEEREKILSVFCRFIEQANELEKIYA